jgi:hypothetical protein
MSFLVREFASVLAEPHRSARTLEANAGGAALRNIDLMILRRRPYARLSLPV